MGQVIVIAVLLWLMYCTWMAFCAWVDLKLWEYNEREKQTQRSRYQVRESTPEEILVQRDADIQAQLDYDWRQMRRGH
jgi:hypothetical protein